MFRHVIVPLDGSETAEQALDCAAAVAGRFDAQMILLRAVEGRERAEDPLATGPRTDLARVAESLRARGLPVDTVLIDGPPGEVILAEAGRRPDALIVMTTHGRGGLPRLLFGSVAQEVLHRSRVPVLLVRAVERPTRGAASDIRIGAEVRGTYGRLGEVHRVIVDARTDRVTDLVVKHDFAFGSERVVPLSHVTGVANGTVYLDVDEPGFAAMDGFVDDRYRAPDPDYLGPPGFDRGRFLVDALAAAGAGGETRTASPLFGYPGGEQTSPDDVQRPVLRTGMDVLDVNGEKVGVVSEFSVDAVTGRPTRLTLRRGPIVRQETDLPVTWIQDLGEHGVLLKVPKHTVEALAGRA